VTTVKLLKKFIYQTTGSAASAYTENKMSKSLISRNNSIQIKSLGVLVISLSGKNADERHSKSGSSGKGFGPRREEVTGR